MLRVKAECSERASHISRRRAAATKTKERDNNRLHFRCIGFSIRREGPELYLRTIERRGLYVSTQFKNSSDVKMCLKQGNMIWTPYPGLADEHTAHEKRIWDFKMTESMKTDHVLEGNLHNLFAVLMSLCDTETKHQVESSTNKEVSIHWRSQQQTRAT